MRRIHETDRSSRNWSSRLKQPSAFWILMVLTLIGGPASAQDLAKEQDEPDTASSELAAAKARASYYLAQLRWQTDRPQDALNVLRQVPPSQRRLEWYLTHHEYSGGDLTCYGHTGRIVTVDFSPDGKLIASGGEDNRVKLWDARTGLEIRTWKGLDVEPNAAGVRASAVQFSPDGKLLAAGCGYGSDIGFKGVIKVWDVKTGKRVKKLSETRWVTRLQFSADGKRIAYGTLNNRVGRVWDLESGKKLAITMNEPTSSMPWAFNPEGSLLALGERTSQRFNSNIEVKNEPCDIVLWDAKNGSKVRTLEGCTTGVLSIAFSSDGSLLAAADRDSHVMLWEVGTGKEFIKLSGNYPVRFTPDGTRLVFKTADKSSIQILNLETAGITEIKEPHKPIGAGPVSPDSTLLAGLVGNRIRLWDIRTGEAVATLRGFANGYQRMAFSPDGAWLVTGGQDQTLRLWDCRIREDLTVTPQEPIAFSPDGLSFATADDTVQLFDSRDGKLIREFKNHTGHVNSLAFSLDGSLIASAGSDQTSRVWETATGKEVAVFKGHSSGVKSVVFHPNGKRLASSDHDKTLLIWEWQTGKQLKKLDANPSCSGFPGRPRKGPDYAHGLAWSPDGKWLLALYDCDQSGPWWDRTRTSFIRLFDAESGEKVGMLKGHKFAVTSAAFSPDSRWIVSAGKDSTIRIWDVAAREEVQLIDGHLGPVHDVTFSSDGNRVLSAGVDSTVRVWDRKSGDELKTYGEAKKTGQSTWSVIRSRCRITLTPDGGEVRAKIGSRIHQWSAQETERVRVLAGPKKPLALSEGGRLVASVSGHSIVLWDTITGKKLRTLTGHSDAIRTLAFNGDGTRLISVTLPCIVKLWDTQTGEELREFQSSLKYPTNLGFHPDGNTILAEGSSNGHAAWDINTGETVSVPNWPHDSLDPQYRSSDGRWLLTPVGSHVRVADASNSNGKELQTSYQAKTAPSALWHSQQAEKFEKKSNWFAAAFHRAWQLKVDPSSKNARNALREADALLGDSLRPAVVPAALNETPGDP